VSRAPGLLFALVREDPAIERSLVARWGARRIVVVGSGGCTALSLLSDAVEEVCVVDASAAQMALVALRAAAVRTLDRDGYKRFVGALDAGDEGARLAAWERIRSELSADARAYWDACPNAIDAGVDASGVTETFYRYVGRSLTSSDWPADVWRSLLDAPSMDVQRAILARHFADDRFRIALEMLLSRGTHELFYPPSIFAHVAEHDFARFFARRFREYGERRLLRANYFLSQIVFGRYEEGAPEGVPPYLTETGYAAARRNLHKLRLVTGRLEDALDGTTTSDAFFLSNVLDWASPEQAARVGTAVVRASRPGAVVLLRHMLGRPGLPPSFDVRFDAVASREAQEFERSFLYGAVSIGRTAPSR
jgi:S-adenosylmethionine:diacylglycerol 3-amino-3-carboxypropyl transferase